jgi:putative salt-induced outer membrane protein YdiY
LKFITPSIIAACLAVPLFGGEIVFKNGDKLTGKVTSLADGKLVIESAVAGTITVDMANVSTFSTDDPVEIHLKDGTVVKQPVVTTQTEGAVATTQGMIDAQELSLTDMEKINPPPVKWTGSVSAGALITSGNSNTSNVSAAYDAVRRTEKDRISSAGQYLYGRQEDTNTGKDDTTTDNWYIAGKYDYFLNEKLYWFSNLRVERDRIADLDIRITPSTGLGYQWIESDPMNFYTEAGLAWVYEDYTNADSNDYFAARLAYHFDRKINDKVSFIHNLEYVPSLEEIQEFNLNTDAGVRVGMTEKLFTDFKFEWRYDSEPAPGADKNDFRYIIAVGWQF